jgi:hypothetical protein
MPAQGPKFGEIPPPGASSVDAAGMTLTTGDTLRHQSFEDAWDQGNPLQRATIWLGGIALVLVGVLLVAVIALSSQVNALQQKVDELPDAVGVSTPAVDLVPVQTELTDLCRLVGGIAARSGVSIDSIFPNGEAVGDCESSAQLGHAAAK